MIIYAFGLEEHNYSGAGAHQNDTYYYSLGGRLLGALDSNGTTFYMTDILGSILASFTNAAGGASVKGNQVFGPYGVNRYFAGNINTAKGFIGQYNDGSGLDYLNARYYNPVMGVFMSADTVQGNGSGANSYAYVNGNPETESDQRLLAWYSIVVSKSRKDDGYDNALIERFNRTLTTEYVEHASYQTHAQARWLIFEYLEAFYHRQRLHSSPGYVSPLPSEL